MRRAFDGYQDRLFFLSIRSQDEKSWGTGMTYDEQIKTDILDELKWDPNIEASEIGVTVKDGAVTLTGIVASYPAKSAAEQAAKRVKGVRAIAEGIKVELGHANRHSDEVIAHRIARLFEWTFSVPHDGIKAEVSNGVVTLSGEVDWQYQRRDAERLVAAISGVIAVANDTKLKPCSGNLDVRKAIVSALHRHATIEASKINVTIADGKVTLSGYVDAVVEKELIEDAVWSAPGVTEVINHLRVE